MQYQTCGSNQLSSPSFSSISEGSDSIIEYYTWQMSTVTLYWNNCKTAKIAL